MLDVGVSLPIAGLAFAGGLSLEVRHRGSTGIDKAVSKALECYSSSSESRGLANLTDIGLIGEDPLLGRKHHWNWKREESCSLGNFGGRTGKILGHPTATGCCWICSFRKAATAGPLALLRERGLRCLDSGNHNC